MPMGVLYPTQNRINEIAILNLVSYGSRRLPNIIGKLLCRNRNASDLSTRKPVF